MLRTCGAQRLRMLVQPEAQLHSLCRLGVQVVLDNERSPLRRLAREEPRRDVRAVLRVH